VLGLGVVLAGCAAIPPPAVPWTVDTASWWQAGRPCAGADCRLDGYRVRRFDTAVLVPDAVRHGEQVLLRCYRSAPAASVDASGREARTWLLVQAPGRPAFWAPDVALTSGDLDAVVADVGVCLSSTPGV
jgi:hypothetical protein